MDRWRGKVAVITGASVGIGAAIAEKFVEEGMQVVGISRRPELVEVNAAKLTNYPGKLHAVKADITQKIEVEEAFNWITNNLGPVHILVNNAGVVYNSKLLDGDVEKWKSTLDTNVLGVCICTQVAVKIMREHEIDGHIVFINSIAGHKVLFMPGINVYGASKYAVTNLTEFWRQELLETERKIKISSISPGNVRTEILGDFGKEFQDWFFGNPCLDPMEVAKTVLFAVGTPPDVEIREIIIKPLGEKY